MSCAIIIPARLSSTRLTEKLLRNDTGQALICHTVDTACQAAWLAADIFTDIIVATDADIIADTVNAHCAEHDLPARAELTRAEHPSGSDRIAEVAEQLPESVDSLLNLQGDEPELAPTEIIALARLLREDSGQNGSIHKTATGDDERLATLAFPIYTAAEMNNPNLVKVVRDARGDALYFSRAAIPHDRDGAATSPLGLGHLGVYAYTRAALCRFVRLPPSALEHRERLEQLRALENGMRIRVGVIQDTPPKGIDTAADYAGFVERMAAK